MDEKPPQLHFAFSKKNYNYLLISVIIVIIGFALLSGGGSEDPNVFLGDYSLNDDSFTKLSGEFAVDQSLITKLEGMRGQVFPGEEELMDAITDKIGLAAMDANYFNIRSATQIDAAMFSARRITIAPLIILLGYGFMIYAIMYREPSDEVLAKAQA